MPDSTELAPSQIHFIIKLIFCFTNVTNKHPRLPFPSLYIYIYVHDATASLDIDQLWHQLSDITSPQRALQQLSVLRDSLWTCPLICTCFLPLLFFTLAHFYVCCLINALLCFLSCYILVNRCALCPQASVHLPWSRFLLLLLSPLSSPPLACFPPPSFLLPPICLFKARTVRFIPSAFSFRGRHYNRRTGGKEEKRSQMEKS